MEDRKVTVITYEEYQKLIEAIERTYKLHQEVMTHLETDRTAVHSLYNLLRRCEYCQHFQELKQEIKEV